MGKKKFISWTIGSPCIFDGEEKFFYIGFDENEGERFACRLEDSKDIRIFPRRFEEIVSIKEGEIETIYKARNSTGPFYQIQGSRGFFPGSPLYQEIDGIIRLAKNKGR